MLSSVEKWVIGSDKKPQFQIEEEGSGDLLPLYLLSGYGVVIFAPDGSELGKFGTGLTGFDSTKVNVLDDNTFEVVLDKELNTIEGYIYYKLYAAWSDSDYDDGDFNAYTENRDVLYKSIRLNYA